MNNIKIIKKLINDESFINNHKNSNKDFTRNRSLTFSIMFALFLKKGLKSLQLLLNESFGKLFGNKKSTITASAFTQARSKFLHTAFIELNEVALLDPFYNSIDDNTKQHTYKTWNGFRLLAVDGSKLYLPNIKEIKKELGEAKGKNQSGELKTYAGALLSTLFDVENNLAIDSRLKPIYSSERDLAIEHLEKTTENDLIIYDRGYSGYIIFALHVALKRNFVCRMQSKRFIESQELFDKDCKISSKIIIIKPHNYTKEDINTVNEKYNVTLPTEITIRFVRIVLKTGEIEVLATTLLDEDKYPTEIFGDLYNKRWGIELHYDIIKNRLNLEHFTGQSIESIKQDIYSTILVSNLEVLMTSEANEELKEKSIEKSLKHAQKVNKQISFNTIKNNVIDILFSDEKDLSKILNKIGILFKTNPTCKRKNRNCLRKEITSNHKADFYKRRKKTCY